MWIKQFFSIEDEYNFKSSKFKEKLVEARTKYSDFYLFMAQNQGMLEIMSDLTLEKRSLQEILVYRKRKYECLHFRNFKSKQ